VPVQCNTLQRTATYCNTLQHTATHYSILQHIVARCNTLQHTVTHYNTLQHTATHCIALHRSATHYNTLQHTTVYALGLFVVFMLFCQSVMLNLFIGMILDNFAFITDVGGEDDEDADGGAKQPSTHQVLYMYIHICIKYLYINIYQWSHTCICKCDSMVPNMCRGCG